MSDSQQPGDDAPVGPLGSGTAPRPLSRTGLVVSVGAVWAVALVLGVLIATLAQPAEYASWLSLAAGVCVLASFAAQLATQQKDGFVDRLAATLTGSFIVLGIIGVTVALSSAGR